MKRLQKILHPDKFSTRSETERAHSADQASLVNRAYAVLRDPLARAKYMLRGRGAGIGEDEGAEGGASGEGTGLIDPELLMEVMETREAIEEAAEDADPESRRRRLRAIDDEAAEKEASRVAAAADALDGGDATLDAARRATVELTYLRARAGGDQGALVTRNGTWAAGARRRVARRRAGERSRRGEARASVRLRPSSRVSSPTYTRQKVIFAPAMSSVAVTARRRSLAGVEYDSLSLSESLSDCDFSSARILRMVDTSSRLVLASNARRTSSTTRSVRCCRRSIACELSSRPPRGDSPR